MDGGAYLLWDKPEAGAIPGFSETHGRSLVWVQEIGPGKWKTLHRTSRSFAEITRNNILKFSPELHLQGLLSNSNTPLVACGASMQKAAGVASTVDLVVDGVCHRTRGIKGIRGWRIALAASHLQTDLGGIDVVEDDTYKELLQTARDLHSWWYKEWKS